VRVVVGGRAGRRRKWHTSRTTQLHRIAPDLRRRRRYARRTSLVRHDAPDAVKHLPVALYCTASGRRQRGGVVGGLRLGPTGGGMRRLMTPSGRP